MPNAPALWGAGLACALGGAIAGNALGSVQPIDRSVLTELYQSHDLSEESAFSGSRPPDHYPLVTRAGTVPVGELGMRGLYRQARYQPRVYAADYTVSDVHVEEYRPSEDWRPETEHQASRVEVEAAAEAEEPLQLAGGPVALPARGEAKSIDVDAVLALR